MKYLLIFFAFVVFCVAPFKPAQAQNQEKVIVVSEKVGDVIDTEERAKFNLWPEIKGFISTVFLQLPDGSYVAEVTYEKDGEKEKIRTPQSETSIASLKYLIENIEKTKSQHHNIEPKQNKSVKSSSKDNDNGAKVLIGALGGILFSVGSYYGIESVSENEYLIGTAMALSLPFGSALGVFAVGEASGQTGSFGATLAGSYTGGLIGCLAFGIVSFVGAPIGATIGYNKSRKEISSPETGFINYKDDRLSLTIPSIYYTQENTFEGKTITQNVTLVKVNF